MGQNLLGEISGQVHTCLRSRHFFYFACHSFWTWLNCLRIFYFCAYVVYIYVHHINKTVMVVIVKVKQHKIIFFPLFAPFSLFRYTDLPIEDYLCPVLRGCTVCVTGLSSAERKEVQRLCEQHGASYTGQLKMNECTHLIVSEPTGKARAV